MTALRYDTVSEDVSEVSLHPVPRVEYRPRHDNPEPVSEETPPGEEFPTRQLHTRRWLDLAAEIAAEADRITDRPAGQVAPEAAGELTVIGSGIETVGFSRADELVIDAADKVFYCVADPATQVWLKERRPDAYDLYVLYDDAKLRHVTYMQMTEAMLHFVRRGMRVVAIFYGHPGVFVLSTHRAIAIARREGHRAVMRAGVSALDTMCADLGFDPSQPGLMTYEATDMLVRRRQPDPALHVVLWQVGLIGELGYRRQGFLNSGFSLLLDHLEKVYGPEQVVTHYVGSRYPGVEPLIEKHSIAELREPAVQAGVTGLSTFYLPPVRTALPDYDVLRELGLLKPGQTLKAPAGPLRVIDRYGNRERKAFADFARFRVPQGYHWQDDTAAARFVLALRDDPLLRSRYESDPAAAVAGWQGGELTPRERALLASRDAGQVQLAAKGTRSRTAPGTARMLRSLLGSNSASRDLALAVGRAPDGERAEAVRDWAAGRGFAVDPATLAEDLDRMLRTTLAPWSGLYLEPEKRWSVFVLGRPGQPGKDRVYLNGQPLAGATYSAGAIRWQTAAGNGHLQTDLTTRGGRRLVGTSWPAGQSAASGDRICLAGHPLPRTAPGGAAPAPLTGEYLLRVAGDSPRLVRLEVGTEVRLDGEPLTGAERDGTGLSWQHGPAGLVEGRLRSVLDPVTGRSMLFGSGRPATGERAVTLTGMLPVSESDQQSLAAEPGLGLPDWAWQHLVELTCAASRSGGLFVFNAWHTAVVNLRMLRYAVRAAGE
ncbi:MAG: hypothetical protein JO144_14755 [Actinobacteria bacterium]|nr:hypothetical protein [Actinomycetota bacterium]